MEMGILWTPLFNLAAGIVLAVCLILVGYWMGRNSEERPFFSDQAYDPGLDPGQPADELENRWSGKSYDGDPYDEAMRDEAPEQRVSTMPRRGR